MSLSIMLDQVQRKSWWGDPLAVAIQPEQKKPRKRSEPIAHVPTAKIIALRSAIISIIYDTKKPLKCPHLADELDMHCASLQYHLDVMVEDGEIIKIKRSNGRHVYYALPEMEANIEDFFKFGDCIRHKYRDEFERKAREVFGDKIISNAEFGKGMGYTYHDGARNSMMKLIRRGLVQQVGKRDNGKFKAVFIYKWVGE